MRKSNSLPEGDDGRTIANMNAEGMPWYQPEHPSSSNGQNQEQLTKKQMRIYTWGAVKAGLLVVAVFSALIVLFILFCTNVWLRVE